MSRKLIDAYLGGIVDLINIGQSEVRNFYFECEQELEGTFELKIWNSDKKNEEFVDEPVVKDGNKLTITINAEDMQLNSSRYYYEISKIENKQIYFKGNLEIID